MQLKNSILQLMQQKDLTRLQCEQVMTDILCAQNANKLQIMAFLLLLRSKFETANELFGIVSALKSQMITVTTAHDVMDIVGTGGDGAGTVNISTGSAILAASCGIKIAKHGNRSASSLSGSADVLEALGVKLAQSAAKVSASIDEIGIGFCFAPIFHPALKHLATLRRELNVPTTLNIIVPLLNPANPAYQLIGVYDEKLLTLFAKSVLRMANNKRAIVVHGGGLDEMSCVGPIKMAEVCAGSINYRTIDAIQFGLPRCTVNDLRGGDVQTNAALLMRAFSGEKGALANTLILNVATALYITGKTHDIGDGINYAREKLFDGSALKCLQLWSEYSHDFA